MRRRDLPLGAAGAAAFATVAASPVSAAVFQDDVRARFEALRAWRRDRASEQHVPPYVIFQDRTLLEIAHAEPGDLNSLGAISGVGQSKLDRYGNAVLAVLAAIE